MSRFNQRQKEALADLITLAAYADDHLSLIEDEKIEAVLGALQWDPNQSIGLYLQGSIARARAAKEEDKKFHQYLEKYCNIFDTDDFKRAAFEWVLEVLKTDGFSESEGAFLLKLRERCKI